VLAFCYIAGAAVFAERGERCGGGLAAIRFTAGVCWLAFFFLLSKVAGSALVVFAALPVLVAALLLIRQPALLISTEDNAAATAGASALIALASTPVLIMGARMGAGEFPAEFFAVDSPFFLQQAYALMRSDGYPPPSLETAGFAFNYHYGVQAFVAVTAILTGLKPHLLLFGVIEPLLLLLAGFVTYDIGRRLTGSRGAAILCLFIVLFASKQYFINYLDPSWWRIVTRQEYFNFRYPNAPDVAGLLVALCAVRCALEFERKNLRLAALFFTCMLPVFKIPYLIPVSAGMALIYAFELRRQFRAGLLIGIAATALISLVIYFVFAKSAATSGGNASAAWFGFAAMMMPWDKNTLLILSTLTAVTAAVTRQGLPAGMSRLAAMAGAPFLVFLSWRLDMDNNYQIFSLATTLATLFAAAYLASAWLNHGRHTLYRYVAAALLVALTAPALLSLANHIVVVAVSPAQGHEYADNRAIAAALQQIPVEGSLIATNDLRYPADRYIRDNRQLQLAGIFGHRNLAANLEYGGLGQEEARRYLKLVRLFQATAWPAAEIALLREATGLTHLLIHKSYAHAADIPLQRLYENGEYTVYRF
jgi:hypothetical protein